MIVRARALAAALAAGRLRWRRPRRGWRGAARRSACDTVGELLEHLPSASRETRTVAALRAGEQATVAVQVRAIAMRPVRRRGMRPLVEATVLDATGSMRATFFNQPWLVKRYPPGTRLLLHGKADAKGGFRVSHHAPARRRRRCCGLGGEARRRRERAPSPTTRRPRASPRRRS